MSDGSSAHATRSSAETSGLRRIGDTALVFEGGGMRCAVTSGMAVELIEAGIAFDWVAGISAGASNTANYLSRDARRARRSFVEFAADPNFGGVRTYLRGQGLFNAEYIYERTGEPGAALPYHWDVLQASPADFRIPAFDAATGQQRVWSKADTPHMSDLLVRVRASSTMPVLMPPVRIDGRTYVDGALGPDGGIALSLAEDEGFERFVFVLTQERGYTKPKPRFPAFFRSYFRRHPAVAEALTTRWQRYNATRERIFALEAEGRAHVFAPERMPVTSSTKDLAKLAAAHRAGRSQARREMPALREFLGL